MLDRAQTARPGPSELFVGFGCGARGCGTGSALVTAMDWNQCDSLNEGIWTRNDGKKF